MYRTKEEKLVDDILGEAVIKLIHSNRAIGTLTLIATLRGMAEKERNLDRKKACLHAINDVISSLEKSNSSSSNLKSTVTQLFPGQELSDNSKKH